MRNAALNLRYLSTNGAITAEPAKPSSTPPLPQTISFAPNYSIIYFYSYSNSNSNLNFGFLPATLYPFLSGRELVLLVHAVSLTSALLLLRSHPAFALCPTVLYWQSPHDAHAKPP